MNTLKEKYINQLSENFRLLSEIVLSQFVMVIDLLKSNGDYNTDFFSEIERNEILIDGLDTKIKEETINAIILFSPRASDLRRVIAYHDMTIYLERIGDIILNVSRTLEKINLGSDLTGSNSNNSHMKNFETFVEILVKMMKHAEKMTANAVIAFDCDNSMMAYETIAMDNKVDEQFRKIAKKLPEVFMNKILSQEEVMNIMGINTISYNIERIADNATNVAEAAVYLSEGKDIRHKHDYHGKNKIVDC